MFSGTQSLQYTPATVTCADAEVAALASSAAGCFAPISSAMHKNNLLPDGATTVAALCPNTCGVCPSPSSSPTPAPVAGPTTGAPTTGAPTPAPAPFGVAACASPACCAVIFTGDAHCEEMPIWNLQGWTHPGGAGVFDKNTLWHRGEVQTCAPRSATLQPTHD